MCDFDKSYNSNVSFAIPQDCKHTITQFIDSVVKLGFKMLC
jgi:hypothetical protein